MGTKNVDREDNCLRFNHTGSPDFGWRNMWTALNHLLWIQVACFPSITRSHKLKIQKALSSTNVKKAFVLWKMKKNAEECEGRLAKNCVWNALSYMLQKIGLQPPTHPSPPSQYFEEQILPSEGFICYLSILKLCSLKPLPSCPRGNKILKVFFCKETCLLVPWLTQKKPARKLNLDDFRPLWPLLLELIHFSLVMLQEQTTVPIVAIDDIIHYSFHQSFIPLSCLIPSTIRRLTKDVLESLREIPSDDPLSGGLGLFYINKCRPLIWENS